MADRVHVTVKEKILIHLLNYSKYKDEVEVPVSVSQEGMANAVGVRRSHIASALKDLKENELVEEKKARIIGEKRRKNAYFLTSSGQREALSLKESIRQKTILFRDEDGLEKEIEISELKDHISEKLSILEVLNRLTEDGIFDLKKKEKEPEEEVEKTIICPFCGQTNKNFELNTVILPSGAQGLSVSCFFCGRDFLVAEISIADQEEARGYMPSLIPSEEAEAAILKTPYQTANPFLVSLGLFFMLISFLLALVIALNYISSDLFIFVLLGFILSLSLLYIGLMNVKHLDAITRRILIVVSAVFVGFIVLFLGLMMEAEYNAEQAWLMASVVLPAFGVFVFGKPLAKTLRSELSLSLGVFLILFGVFSIAFYELFSSSSWYSPFWVIAGALMVFTSYEIEKLDKTFILRATCVGTGAFIAIFCFIVLISQYVSFGLLKSISAFLWLILGVDLVTLRFVSKQSCDRSLSAMKIALMIGIGVLFSLVGILLGLNGRYMESAVEFFIGIPIVWYGISNAKEFEASQIAFISFVIFSEVFSVLSFTLT